MAGYFIEQLG